MASPFSPIPHAVSGLGRPVPARGVAGSTGAEGSAGVPAVVVVADCVLHFGVEEAVEKGHGEALQKAARLHSILLFGESQGSPLCLLFTVITSDVVSANFE